MDAILSRKKLVFCEFDCPLHCTLYSVPGSCLNLGFGLKCPCFMASKVVDGFSNGSSNISPFRPPDVHTNLFELCWEICLNLRGQIRLKL